MRGSKAKRIRKDTHFHPNMERTYVQRIKDKMQVPKDSAHPSILRAFNQVLIKDYEQFNLPAPEEGKVWIANKAEIRCSTPERVRYQQKKKETACEI